MKRSFSRQPTVLVEQPVTIKRTRTLSRSKTRKSENGPRRSVPWRDIVDFGRGFPKMAKIVHRYVETVPLTSTAGVIARYQWSANGLYDPNITSTGHQPYYFDQLGAIYAHFCVIGSKIKVTCVNTGGTTDPAYQFGMYINDDTDTIANVNFMTEQTTGQFKTVPAGNNNVMVLNSNWSAKKYFGKDPLDNTDLQGTIALNPNEQSYYNICVQANGTSTVATAITVEIEYITVWKEVKEVTQS